MPTPKPWRLGAGAVDGTMATAARLQCSRSRRHGGLRASHAYRKLRVPVTDDNRDEACETNFQCLYRDSEGNPCHKTFVKSTSLIVHY